MTKKGVETQKTKKTNTKADKKSASGDSAVLASADEAHFVGIDLGTSRSAVSANNGVREMTPSYVGYPKDNISVELLGTQPLYGEAALKHRLSVDLVRPLAHGVIQGDGDGKDNKHLRAAKQLIHQLIALTQPEPGKPIYGVIGAPARASIASQRAIIDAARGILDAVMVVSEPFTVAYGLGMLDQSMIIDIGGGTVDLCRLHGTLPGEEDQITLDQAGDYVDSHLASLIRKKHPKAEFSINMVRALKERHGFVSDNSDRVKARFPVKGRPMEFDITSELQAACKSIVPDIVDSIAELIATYDPEFQEVIRSNVILAGGGSQMIGLRTLVEQGMEELGGGKVTRVEEPLYAGSNGALKMAQRMPAHFWKTLA